MVDDEGRHEVDERRGDREEDLDHREEDASHHRRPDREVGDLAVLRPEAVHLLALAAKGLAQQDAGDGERLLGDGAHLGLGFLREEGDLAPRVPRPVGEEEEDRHHEEGERGELPAEHQHRHQGARDDDHVGDDRGGGVGHHRLDAADVVGEAGLDLPGAGGGEEAHREPLEVPVEGVAQVLHQPLADAVDLVGLGDPDRAGDHRDEDHQPGVDAHQPHVGPAAPAREESVEDELDQDRVDDAQARGEDDQPHREVHLAAVGAEEAHHLAAEVAVGHPAARLLGGGGVCPAVHGQEASGRWRLTTSL